MNMKLSTKILIPVAVLIVLLTGALSTLYLWFVGGLVTHEFEKNGYFLATNMSTAGRIGILMKDSSQLTKPLESVEGEKEILFIGFYDEGGALIASRGAVPRTKEIETIKNLRDPLSIEIDYNSVCQQIFMKPVYARSNEGTPIGFVAVAVSQEELRADKRASVLWSVGIAFVLLGAGFVGIRQVLLKYVVHPIQQVVSTIHNADLNSRFNSVVEDEVGDLQRAFDKFVGEMRETLLQVSESSAAVASASSEISGSTEQMAAGSHEQTTQTSEVAAAVEEMTKTLSEGNVTIRRAEQTAKQAKEEAKHGGEVVNKTIEGMHRIAEVSHQSAEQVKILGDSSTKIGEIIGVIDDIADQTNLLALNAAIEAARAGEQGRGFAVVADEVRKLAERTTKATKEIAVMIRQIQIDTSQAVSSMQKGTAEVNGGIALAEQAGQMLQNIVTNAQSVAEMMTQVAASSDEQLRSAEQISKNVEAISTVTQQSASGTQQIARTAEDLNRLTETLQQLIDKFRLSDTSSSEVKNGQHLLSKSESKSEQKKSFGKAVTKNGHIVDQY